MITVFKELFHLLKSKNNEFIEKGLLPIEFIDINRGQISEPEVFEYYPLPAIFVDYEVQGQGANRPRLLTLTLHVVTDELPDASNIADFSRGLNRFLYHGVIQEILEGRRLGGFTTPLNFVSENLVEEAVVNYHTQVYQCEVYYKDLFALSKAELEGFIEEIRLQGDLIRIPIE